MLPPLRRRRRGGLGRGWLFAARFVSQAAVEATPSRPPPSGCAGKGRGVHAPSLAPEAQGRAGEGLAVRGVPCFAGCDWSYPLPTSPSRLRRQGEGLCCSLPCAGGAGEGWGGVGCSRRALFCRLRLELPPPDLPLPAAPARGGALLLPPLRRRRRGGLGRGWLFAACFVSQAAVEATPSQPPPPGCAGKGRGVHAPSLAPKAQGRVGEGLAVRGALYFAGCG